MAKPSKIFVGYRALGYVSNHIPLSVKYVSRKKENFAVTVVGKCFHTYGCDKLNLLSVSKAHPEEISALVLGSNWIFTACKNIVYAWCGTEPRNEYVGHEADVHLLLAFGSRLISIDANSNLMDWDMKSKALNFELSFSNSHFRITAVLHPSTYLNKVLLGSKQGQLQLWNLKTAKMIHEFAGWGSPVTVLEQAPAIDVVAIGLVSGEIYIHNLQFDETLMKFKQEWGPVTSISFRTDGKPLMASGSTVGHIVVWDLEKRQWHSEMRDAHSKPVSGMRFLHNEPLLVTSSSDNTLKVWIFDLPDDSGQLLKRREGHSEPPSKIRYHGSNGKNILSSGFDSTLRSFSTCVDNLNKNLGQASYNRKVAKKKGIKNDPGKMPHIIDFTSEVTREKEWDNIVACHRGLSKATTWSYDRCKMGEFKLLHERFKGQTDVCALCVNLSACGHFVLLGYSNGYVDKFNVQSGLFRGTYGKEKAHNGSVRGVVSDGLNQLAITGGSDKKLKFWKFKDGLFLTSLELEEMVSQMIIHRESNLIAVALDNFSVIIVDQDTKRIVRRFDEHLGKVNDMTFSCDSRWLIVASMDSTIKTWDLPTGRLLDNFCTSPVCTSMSMSPSSDFLATAHADDLGIYLWSNMTLYTHVSLQPLPSDYEPRILELPVVSLEGSNVQEDGLVDGVVEMEVSNDQEEEEIAEFQSPEQMAEHLVTLSLLPNSRWQNLLRLDVIKMRNKPKEPVTVPKNAPFFLPVVSGLKPTFAKDESIGKKNKIDDSLMLRILRQSSSFVDFLMKCRENKNYECVIERLKEMSPSLIDVEIRCLAPLNGGSIDAMLCFMESLDHSLKKRTNFEVVQSYLGLFLQTHGEILASESELKKQLSELKTSQRDSWCELQSKFNQCICLVNYLKSAVI